MRCYKMVLTLYFNKVVIKEKTFAHLKSTGAPLNNYKQILFVWVRLNGKKCSKHAIYKKDMFRLKTTDIYG